MYYDINSGCCCCGASNRYPMNLPHGYASQNHHIYDMQPYQQAYSLPQQPPMHSRHMKVDHIGAKKTQGANIRTEAHRNQELHLSPQMGAYTPYQPQRRISYCPFVRRYIDYEHQYVCVPIEKSRQRYYTVINETQYIPKEYNQKIVNHVPEQKIVEKLRYIPVEQTLIHFPIDELNERTNMHQKNTQHTRPTRIEHGQNNSQNIYNYNKSIESKNISTKVKQTVENRNIQIYQNRPQYTYSDKQPMIKFNSENTARFGEVNQRLTNKNNLEYKKQSQNNVNERNHFHQSQVFQINDKHIELQSMKNDFVTNKYNSQQL